ncbi:MAG: DUF4286 family protein [Gemmatimonadota bacterium]
MRGVDDGIDTRTMVTYEVTAVVDESLVDEYEEYMRSVHVPDLLATGCFVGASFSRAGGNRYRMRYEAPNRETLDRYLAEHAGALREHVQEQFPSGVLLSREEWTVVEVWPVSGSPPR